MSALANCPTQILHNRAKGTTDTALFEFEDCVTNTQLFFPHLAEVAELQPVFHFVRPDYLEMLESVPTRYFFLKPTSERVCKCFLAIRNVLCAVS